VYGVGGGGRGRGRVPPWKLVILEKGGGNVEMCNFGKRVVPCRLVICKTGGCYRGDR
jgi:hypothetical protein